MGDKCRSRIGRGLNLAILTKIRQKALQILQKKRKENDERISVNPGLITNLCSPIPQFRGGHYIFSSRSPVIEEIKDFEQYLRQVLVQMKYFQTFSQKQMFYLCKDFTFFDFFYFPKIAIFKSFFWMRDILGDERLKSIPLSLTNFPYPNILELGREVTKAYNKIVSVEILNAESINSTIGQIQYYNETGVFASEEDLIQTCESLEEMIRHKELIAEKGVKFFPGESDLVPNGRCQYFLNEVILGNTTITVKLEGKIIKFIPHVVFKYMTTHDLRFGEYTMKYITKLMNRSTLISSSGSKERGKFFNRLRQKVRNLKLNHSMVD